MKVLFVIDVQNDFLTGPLGTKEAQAAVPNIVKKIREFDGYVFATVDQHNYDYLNTLEGKKLPVPHCIKDTEGEDIPEDVEKEIHKKTYDIFCKKTFGTFEYIDLLNDINKKKPIEKIEIVGFCTDICVISNALILRAAFPNVPIEVDAKCCAGVTPELHEAALKVMKSCQIDII